MLRIDGFTRAYYFGGLYFSVAGGNLDEDAVAEVSAAPRGGVAVAFPGSPPLSAKVRGGLSVEFDS